MTFMKTLTGRIETYTMLCSTALVLTAIRSGLRMGHLILAVCALVGAILIDSIATHLKNTFFERLRTRDIYAQIGITGSDAIRRCEKGIKALLTGILILLIVWIDHPLFAEMLLIIERITSPMITVHSLRVAIIGFGIYGICIGCLGPVTARVMSD